jgi:uncharacterized protein YcbX
LIIQQLWRYPVKSMLGEACASLRVDARGAEGDRLYAVRDAQGKLGSGKTSGRHQRMDGLFGFRARRTNGAPSVVFPDGRTMQGDDPAIHAALSAALELPVTLVRESGPRHFDSAPIHIVTTASLAWLRQALPDGKVDERRFRPNLLIEAEGATPLEQQWLGKTLQVGSLQLRVTDPTERCRMTTLAQGDLPEDLRVLREIAQQQDAQFGVYADVVAPGEVRVGDPVKIL